MKKVRWDVNVGKAIPVAEFDIKTGYIGYGTTKKENSE